MRSFFFLLFAGVAVLFVPVVASASTLTDTNFIDELYEDVLNRAPSPLELTEDLALLGSVSHQQLAAQILASSEYQIILVDNYFQSYLDRTPSTFDLSSSLALLGSKNDQTLQETILGSPEFFNDKGSSDAGFVKGLFSTLLGRAPRSIEESLYVSQLGSFTRAQVAGELLGSAEYNQDLITSYFEQYLDRSPTSTDFASFVLLLESPGNDETVQAEILGSAEYNSVAQEENAPLSTPEPSSLLLFSTALLGFGVMRQRRFARA